MKCSNTAMLVFHSFFASGYFGMNEKQEFTYSYRIDRKKYLVKLHLRDKRIEVARYFPFMKEARDVVVHLMEVYGEEGADPNRVHTIEEMELFFSGKLDKVLKLIDA